MIEPGLKIIYTHAFHTLACCFGVVEVEKNGGPSSNGCLDKTSRETQKGRLSFFKLAKDLRPGLLFLSNDLVYIFKFTVSFQTPLGNTVSLRQQRSHDLM